MAIKTVVLQGVMVLTAVACLAIVGCNSKKAACSRCSNNAECQSGACVRYFTNSGDQFLLCSGQDTCDVPR